MSCGAAEPWADTGQIFKFPDGISRRTPKDGTPEKAIAGAEAKMPGLPIMTGDQHNEFIRLLGETGVVFTAGALAATEGRLQGRGLNRSRAYTSDAGFTRCFSPANFSFDVWAPQGVVRADGPEVPSIKVAAQIWQPRVVRLLARSERFELPTLGFEVRCSIQLSYERAPCVRLADLAGKGQRSPLRKKPQTSPLKPPQRARPNKRAESMVFR